MSLSEQDKADMAAHLTQTLTVVVNGKIDRLQTAFDANAAKQDKEHVAMMDKIGELEEKVLPMFETYTNATGFKKTLLQVSIVVGSLSGIIVGGSQILKIFGKQ